MSGTSLDGVDLAIVKFKYFNKRWSYELLSSKTKKYSIEWVKKLKKGVNLNKVNLSNLDNDYTKYLALIINNFISFADIKIDFVSSHGHTIIHNPKEGFTFQIGNNEKLANLTCQSLICDFRIQDVLLGGQGAPLVPAGDYHLFSDYTATLNIGGFANITKFYKSVIAYDICPVNTVLNRLSNQLNVSFDDKGLIASSGNLIDNMLEDLNSLSFYNQPAPKSLGVEWVEEKINPIINKYKSYSVSDLLNTFVIHISSKIADQLPLKGKVLLTGGGVYNEFLIELVKSKSNCELIIPNSLLIEYKEAIIFAFLGVLRIRNEINCFKSVTGASMDHSSGTIYKK